MESRKFEIIQELMDQLQEEMGHSEEELGLRLGREKPKVEVLSLEAGEDLPIEGMDPEMDEMEMGPEEKLKERLMKLRG